MQSDSIEITLDATAPTVTLSDTDDDNFLAASDTVTITAAFSEGYDFYANDFDIRNFHFKCSYDNRRCWFTTLI